MLLGMEPFDEDAPDMPDEELLRLDDGTCLPAELAELRSLLELTFMTCGDSVQAEADDETSSELLSLSASKSEVLRDCLLSFDESVLLLHDKVLDHEALCKRLDAVRRHKRAAPVGRYRFDEEVTLHADDGGEVDDAGDSGGDGAFDLGNLLAASQPGGAAASKARCAAGGEDDAAIDDDDENEEALDQRVAASRRQIKDWLRALEEGKRENAPKGRTKLDAARGVGDGGGVVRAPTAALPPVVPPPRARPSGFSNRLRLQAAHWNVRSGHL